ncbi:hypothetical protein ILYODFUR_030043 [Ilyodon furcidens]|uniref:Uncharacterized protein n=1 Tax=Ilyodon furcidens TaxID=33524 RepID=A0ABV0V7A2_9TELE
MASMDIYKAGTTADPTEHKGSSFTCSEERLRATRFGAVSLNAAEALHTPLQELKAALTSAEDPMLLLTEPRPGRHININSCLK